MPNNKLLVGNWKMYLGREESINLLTSIRKGLASQPHPPVWIAPSFPFLSEAARTGAGVIQIGAQNVHWENSGAFTGEVSARSLKECGCSFCIVGHSERRALCFETSEMVAKRMTCGIAAGLDVIACIGETLEQRERGETSSILREQVAPLLERLTRTDLQKLIIAYEPVWAIGTGKYPTDKDIEAAHLVIAEEFRNRFGAAPPILYGGSVSPENIAQILKVPGVQGALIGKASITVDSLTAIVRAAAALA